MLTALSVLVIEDDAMIAMLLAEMLEEIGYIVCAVAATEEDAVAHAARCKPGLMIVDEHLREGSGVSAVERILRTGPVSCVFISGGSVHGVRPGETVLQKPFLENDLVRAIRHAVGSADTPTGPANGHEVLGPKGVSSIGPNDAGGEEVARGLVITRRDTNRV
jgi:DNA-binding response OmpR family regulator